MHLDGAAGRETAVASRTNARYTGGNNEVTHATERPARHAQRTYTMQQSSRVD